MLVFAQVSSMKTRRLGSIRPWYFFHCARRRATSGRSCSAACRLFFERHILGTEEVPDRFATHLDVARRQLGAHPSQGQVRCGGDPRQKPIALGQKDQLPVAPPHRLGRRTPGCPGTLTPAYHARLANPQQTGHFPTAPSPCHQRYGTLTKIQRVRTRHSCWPPHPSQHLESQTHPQGNPSRFTSGETGSRTQRRRIRDYSRSPASAYTTRLIEGPAFRMWQAAYASPQRVAAVDHEGGASDVAGGGGGQIDGERADLV